MGLFECDLDEGSFMMDEIFTFTILLNMPSNFSATAYGPTHFDSNFSDLSMPSFILDSFARWLLP
jgi:hypothetical protein